MDNNNIIINKNKAQTILELILAFIAGNIFQNVYLGRWESEPTQVISCALCMVFLIFSIRIVKWFHKTLKDY